MTGEPELPVRLTNSLLINAAFPLPSNHVRPLLPAQAGLNLVEVFPGRAVLVISFALYRESPFGSYAEAVLALMASHEKTVPVMTLAMLTQASRYPAYVLHMLLDNAEAQHRGIELWALPRQLARVEINEQPGQDTCSASLDGQLVVQMVAERPEMNRSRSMQVESYSLRGDALLHTVMQCQAQAYGRNQGGGASIIWGDHPIGQQFGAMEISTLPLMVRYYDRMQAVLGAPTQVDA